MSDNHEVENGLALAFCFFVRLSQLLIVLNLSDDESVIILELYGNLFGIQLVDEHRPLVGHLYAFVLKGFEGLGCFIILTKYYMFLPDDKWLRDDELQVQAQRLHIRGLLL